jgi:hypothetical protein
MIAAFALALALGLLARHAIASRPEGATAFSDLAVCHISNISLFRYEETRMYSNAVKYIYSLLFGRARLSSFLKKPFGILPEKYPIVSAEFPRFRHLCLALALSR